ncbi:MAG TPA: hypothetical protein VGP47_00335 [Parachlamydiaceae bacterium]|nr:hypothetical protein [Parachlamydiaceae bacterium]
MKFTIYIICLCLNIASLTYAKPSDEKKYFFSQASQDHFTHIICNAFLPPTGRGCYLEIGSSDPIFNNNTYYFEKNFNWEGISIEIEESYREQWYEVRQNPLLIEDALKVDYHAVLQSFPRLMDYLSLDVDGSYDLVLQRIPFDQHVFKVITIEHDFYRFGDNYREKERTILKALGYYLLCPDVSHVAVGSFEDWWIHPCAFSPEEFLAISSLDLKEKLHDDIISILQGLK